MKREGDGRKVSKTSNKANSELRSGGGCGGVFFTGRFGVVLMYSAARHAHFKQTGCSYMRLIRALCSGGKELGGVRCGEYVLEGMRSTRGGRGNVIDRCSYGVMQMASLGTISSSHVPLWAPRMSGRGVHAYVPQKNAVLPPRLARGATSSSSAPTEATRTEKEEEAEKPSSTSSSSSSSSSDTASNTKKSFASSSPVSWLSLGLALVTGTLALSFYEREMKRMKAEKSRSVPVSGTGTAKIGGSFTLKTMDEKGRVRTFTDKDLHGKWNLLYFGFTYCPDICPTELEKLCEAVDVLKKKFAIDVRPIFLSVDPKRDSPMQVWHASLCHLLRAMTMMMMILMMCICVERVFACFCRYIAMYPSLLSVPSRRNGYMYTRARTCDVYCGIYTTQSINSCNGADTQTRILYGSLSGH